MSILLPATVALVVAVPFCLAFSETRSIGVVGAVVLAFLHPLVAIAALFTSAVGAIVLYQRKRSSSNAQPDPHPRSD